MEKLRLQIPDNRAQNPGNGGCESGFRVHVCGATHGLYFRSGDYEMRNF